MLLALILAAATSTNDFPFAKGVAVQHIQWDGGNVQAYGIICGTNMSCAGTNFGWVTLNAGTIGDGGGGGSGAPTNASYITEVAESGLSAEFAMASLGTGLVKNTTTTGVPSIYGGTSCTNQFPRSLNASGAATCASVALGTDVSGTLPVSNGGTGSAPASDDQVLVSDSSSAATWRSVPNCTDTVGQHLNYTASTNGWSCGTSSSKAAGGSNPQVQYNNAGTLGGLTNVNGDGVRLSIVAETSHPSAPAGDALHYDEQVDSTLPAVPYTVDSLSGLPIPSGALSGFVGVGTRSAWFVGCAKPASWAITTTLQTNLNSPSVTGTASANAWATTSWYTRQKVVLYNTAASTNSGSGVRENATTETAWLGNASGVGGFLFWMRFSTDTARTNQRVAVGMFNTTGVLNAANDPNVATDSVYMGCNSGDSNFSMCSNDNSGNATCNTLGASYPCTTTGATYDLWLYAAPNASSIKWYVERLDSAANTHGSISSDLPRSTVQLAWQAFLSTASGSVQAKFGFLGFCIAVNP